MQRIDLRLILQRTVSTLYGDLVTRPTGRAVRGGIEEALSRLDGEQVAVIDFTTVRLLDISCADEVVGKLLLQYGSARYFLLHGVSEAHREAIEPVLERHRLAVVAQDRDGAVQLLGPVEATVRRAFDLVRNGGVSGADEVAARLSVPVETARRVLNELLARRLVLQSHNGYVAPSPS
jgi:hypothetical protein